MRGLLKFIYRLDKSWDHCDATVALYWYIGLFSENLRDSTLESVVCCRKLDYKVTDQHFKFLKLGVIRQNKFSNQF